MKYLLFILVVTSSFFSYGQKKNYQFELPIRKTTTPVNIDGNMNEIAWQEAATAGNFFMVTPMDTSKAHVNTEVKMTYDKNNLYIIAICYLPVKGPYMVESLRRDFVFGKNDNFIFFLDPYNDLTNGYTFGANAAGAQWDGTLYEGGKADLNWDNKWVSVVKNYDDKWIFEAAIPFKTIRYKKGIMQWGVNFSRLDITAAEKSAWAPVPRQFPTASLAYTGQLIWDQPLPDPGLNLSIIPYALTGISKDYTLDKKASFRREIGADAKIALTSSLNLDLTVNPDYSQVEVDRQVTNLDRFELFFPERRQFFLENNDLFGNFGFTNIRPFFSRRIGLGVPISFGARLSGNIDKNWRIGAMNMQTKKVNETGLPAQNFSVLALQRKVFARSNFRLLFINKQSLQYDYKDSTQPKYTLYNRNFGAEYNLASSNNLWTGKMMLLKSFSPGNSDNSFTQASLLQYNSRNWLIAWQQEYVGKGYSAEVGYVPRNNYIKLNPYIGYLFFPAKKGKLLNHGPRYNGAFFYNSSFKKTDYENLLLYIFNFRNQSVFDVWVADSYIKLLQPFDPTNSNKDTLSAGTVHRWKAFGIEFFSKPQQLLTYNISTRFGGYYAGGNRYNVTADIGYRFQPYVGITLNMTYNDIRLPAPWGNTKFWLIGPRVDITFTNTVFLTTFVQYNNQQKNINLNTRFQWRYRPASDLFLVYTDNYYSAPLYVRNRAFVLKAVYWWNN